MIKLKNIHKTFNSKGIAGLNGVNLEISRGEILSIMGANGSGKTTLLNIINGNISCDKGEISLVKDCKFYKDVSVDPNLNVQNFLISSVEKDMDEEKKIQLSRDMADVFEFTFQLRQTFSQLSAGQKQKVLLASFLINSPDIILLDEPFTHLDPFTRKGIFNYLFEILKRSQTTTIWVTHDTADAFEFSTRVALMNFGKIEQVDTPLEISSHPKNLFVAQFLGHKNFLPIKKKNDSWNSDFGTFKSANEPAFQEGYLIVPKSSWEIKPGISNCRIESIFSQGENILLELEASGRKLWANYKPNWGKLSKGDSVSLVPLFDECLTIPL